MMVQVTVGKWGNNLTVRLPGEIVQAARLRDGERVEVEAHDGDVIIRRTEPQVVLADLFRGKTPEEWRAEYADVYDWGRGYRPRGRSRVTTPGYVPSAGDLIWTDFDPTKGREQAGRRPALVISAAAFSANTGLAVVCPITSRVRPFPTSVVLLPGLPVAGEILTSHVRSIDTPARPVRYAGASIPPEVAQLVRTKL